MQVDDDYDHFSEKISSQNSDLDYPSSSNLKRSIQKSNILYEHSIGSRQKDVFCEDESLHSFKKGDFIEYQASQLSEKES